MPVTSPRPDQISYDSSGIISLDDTEIGFHVDDAAEDFSQHAMESNFHTSNFVLIPFGEPSGATGSQFVAEFVPLPSFPPLPYCTPGTAYQHVEQASNKSIASRNVRKPRE